MTNKELSIFLQSVGFKKCKHFGYELKLENSGWDITAKPHKDKIHISVYYYTAFECYDTTEIICDFNIREVITKIRENTKAPIEILEKKLIEVEREEKIKNILS
jgi:hypothetical protein